MKKVLVLAVLISGIAWLSGCATSRSIDGFHPGGGGGGGGNSATFAAGNWRFHTTSGINGDIYLGGFVSETSGTVSGNLHVVGNSGTGFTLTKTSTPMAVTGTVDSSNVLTLTGTAGASSFTFHFPNIPTSGSVTSLDGTYSVTGGLDTGDSGSVGASIVPDGAYTGTWLGTSAVSGGTVTFNLTEATTASTDGSFQLTPTSGTGIAFGPVTGCVVTGTVVSQFSYAAGDIVFLDVTTTDNAVAGEMTFLGLSNSSLTPTTLSGAGYLYNGGSGCFLDNSGVQVPFSLAKQ